MFHKATLIFCLFIISPVFCSPKDEAKKALQNIQMKTISLKKNIQQDLTHKQRIDSEIAETEKQIGLEIHQMSQTRQAIDEKNQNISTLQHELERLEKKYRQQQKMLSEHLLFRYKIRPAHPAEWILNQHKRQEMSHFITYYQHLIQQDHVLISSVKQTQTSILNQKNQLNQQLIQLQSLQQSLAQHHQQLTNKKVKHQVLLKELAQHIQTKQEKLSTYQEDQTRLQRLIEQLSRQSSPVTQHKINTESPNLTGSSFTLKQNFHSPLAENQRIGKRYNQGVFFAAKAGTPVTTVLPGKIVFSDWLNGYGLLLIIDHGNGVMSLYAHNESLFKTKGDTVRPGDQIATVGHTGGIRENGLYFELRRRGKVVPPRQWLA